MSKHETHKVTLRVWRQKNRTEAGRFVDYPDVEFIEDMSFLELLDVLNEKLVLDPDDEPIAFDYDCREGICGSCGVLIQGVPHGPLPGITACQLHMRHLKDERGHFPARITVEPWRARPFPVIKDLVVDRSAFDEIIEAGGYVSVDTGGAPDANEIPIPKVVADEAFDYATCIGCGACVAVCKNAAAHLFTGAKVAHLGMLPQGRVERDERALNMVDKMEELGFGACSNEAECEAVCPKNISVDVIAILNRDYTKASLKKMFSRSA